MGTNKSEVRKAKGRLINSLFIFFFGPLRYLITVRNFAFCDNNQLIICHTCLYKLRLLRHSQGEKRAEWEVSIRQNIRGDVLEKRKYKIWSFYTLKGKTG